ncbi:contactin-associated protein-like 4 [Exaiptasia diaphana]|uniref:Neurexin n=1 Tax=Exaiptasia diaphana TaxID=2652724 RepID=A0A913WUM3_EXADI|nr:contactin-associated protein-like 4 [Exaiptasia diaphana]XP_020894378.1 contactin-associated protein-like 4 [Exaiptasia diaphana]XP_028513207.1 contactin-associated protein-like 4 [Exaiptasia diaphana]KXJ17705.1 Contactin-associated protein 1 [Exaiptasia diaphana]
MPALMKVWFIIYVIIFCLPRLYAFSDKPAVTLNFAKDSYITYKLATTIRSRQDRIKLLFRTIKPSGLLMHAGDKHGDFITLELYRGRLRYTANLGTIGNNSGYHEIFYGENLADNEWHQIDLYRAGKNILMFLDNQRKTSKANGSYATLEIDDDVYIAGVSQAAFKRAQTLYNRKEPFINFEGCLDHILLNRWKLAELTKHGDSNITIHGNVSIGCPSNDYSPITFKHSQSHVIVTTSTYTNSLSFSFKFRTYETDGLLATHISKGLKGADVRLWLIDSRIKLEVSFLHRFTQLALNAGDALNDGLWHSVSVFVSGSTILLELDGKEHHHGVEPARSFTNSLQVMFGGSASDTVGLVGCINDIFVQRVKINASQHTTSDVLFNKCIPNDRCFPNPCHNGGRCTQRQAEFTCDCSRTNHTGPRCYQPITNKESCQDWKNAGKTTDGYYWISPNGVTSFRVYCRMHDAEETVTIIKHTNIEAQEKAYRPSTRKQGFYFHPIRYKIDLARIRALIAKSSHCRQHLRYNCLNSPLFDSAHEFKLETGRGARWISRDGKTMDYWAGAKPGSQKCACGLTGTCIRHDLACNCDAWDGVWRRDEGYIIDSSTLPVTNIKFSVRGTSKSSNFTLGDLECFGKKELPTTQAPSTITRDFTSHKSTFFLKTETPNTIRTTKPPTPDNTTVIGKTTKTDESTFGPPIDNPPRIVIIESQGKYITIRENEHQELILIILSVILAVFIIAIIVLMVRQNLFLPCKCIDGPAYRDVNHVDSVELGPPSSLFTNVDTEVIEYETSPYPLRGMNGVLINSTRRHESSIHVNMLESIDDTDRLHLSGGSSSSDCDEKEDCNKNKCESPDYEDIDCLEMVLMTSPQEMIEIKVEKLKEALYEVISASEVNINNNPVTKETRDDIIQEDENFNNTLSSSGMQFSRPPSYQEIEGDTEGECSSSQETQSDSTHAQSSTSASSSWDENSDYEDMDNIDMHHHSPLYNHCTVEVLSIDKNDHISINDHYVNIYDSPDNTFQRESSTHHLNRVQERLEGQPLITKTSSSNQNALKTSIHRNEPITAHHVSDVLLTQSDSETMPTDADHNDCDFRRSDSDDSQ